MRERDGTHRVHRRQILVATTCAAMGVWAGCRDREGPHAASPSPALRIGVAQLSTNSPTSGLRQLVQNLSVELLLRPGEDGRLQPQLADAWTVAPDGASVSVHLRPGVKFHDGSPLNAEAVVKLLPDSLRTIMGPVFEDIDGVTAPADDTVRITFRKASPLLLEALEAQVFRKQGASTIATGPYVIAPDSTTEMRANGDYYLGRPIIDRLIVSNYPTMRSAWAEMLRDRLDMLYEVNTDALDSMEASTTVAAFPYTRHYQYVVALNTEAPALRSNAIRRALNYGIDRTRFVSEALNGHGVASSEPISPRYWALPSDAPRFSFQPRLAAETLRGQTVRFTCLIPPDTFNERIALQVKKQLSAIGVEMAVEEASQGQIMERLAKRQYEAALVDGLSGPTLLRPYLLWHSNTSFNPGGLGNSTIDAALDLVREAKSENEYRRLVAGLQQAFVDDPPAIFLAWSVRARAVSSRFLVPPPEPSRDILSTLRLWKPTAAQQRASRN